MCLFCVGFCVDSEVWGARPMPGVFQKDSSQLHNLLGSLATRVHPVMSSHIAPRDGDDFTHSLHFAVVYSSRSWPVVEPSWYLTLSNRVHCEMVHFTMRELPVMTPFKMTPKVQKLVETLQAHVFFTGGSRRISARPMKGHSKSDGGWL